MKIRDELIDELKYSQYEPDDIELIKIRYIAWYDNRKTYDYIGNNIMEIENLEYDDGFGRQELYGYVWFKDGSWLERFEYDGSEEWKLVRVEGPRKDITLDELVK